MSAMEDLTGYAVLIDAERREVSDRVRVTCELQPWEYDISGLHMEMRIKEAPITLTPNAVDVVVRAIVVFDGGGDMAIGRPNWFHPISQGDVFTISGPATASI